MPRIRVLRQLPPSRKRALLQRLESIGHINIIQDITNNLLYPLPPQQVKNREFLSRYLLLAAVLDQQADSASARRTTVELYNSYRVDFFLKPRNYLDDLYNIVSLASQYYKPKTRVVRMKVEGLLLLRIGGYLLTLINIVKKYGGLLVYFTQATSPRSLLIMVLQDHLLRGLLYDKAARMYVGWISHPRLWIDVSSGSWSVYDIPMVVNGHVCKVLARSGFLPDVLVENVQNMIVKARDERDRIDRIMRQSFICDYFMLDYGAFYVGINYCDEHNPDCDACPINRLCVKDTRFRAY